MGLIIYIAKDIVKRVVRKGYTEHSDFARGMSMYRHCNVPKKSIFKVTYDVISLYRYWKAFPDTYFRFGMFVKGYDDIKQMRSFLPQDAYYKISADRDSRYHLLIDDKIIFHDIMSYYGIPVPYRYFTFRNNEFRCGSKILSDEQVDVIIGDIDDERVFVKRFTGGAASGVSVFTKHNNHKGEYVDSEGVKVSASMIRNKYHNQDFFFEKQLVQDSVLAKLNPDTVNTCRVMTYKNKVISCNIRVGRKGSYVDNAAKGGIVLSLDMKSGRIREYGLREYDLTRYYEHPDTKIKFKDYEVPMWPAVKELVERTSRMLPYYNSVGFDVATTVDGPVIIEINSGTGVYASQMGMEYGIADKFKQK